MRNAQKHAHSLTVQQAAAARYVTLLRYETFCKVLAWLTLGLGGFLGIIMTVNMAAVAQEEETFVFAVSWFFGCGFSWFGLMVTANMIKAFVDIAINSFISIELQKID